MSLIRSKQQEANVSNVISANVSVMDKECWWKTSVGDGAGGKGWRPVFLFCFSVLVMAKKRFRNSDALPTRLWVQGQLGIKWITVRKKLPFFEWLSFFLFLWDCFSLCMCACWRGGLRHAITAGQLCISLCCFKLPGGGEGFVCRYHEPNTRL